MKTLSRSVVAACLFAASAASAFAGVTISSPQNQSQVASPFTLSASASNCSRQNVTSIGYALDSMSDPGTTSGNSLNVQVSASAGAHTVYVVAYGAKKATCVAEVAITVAGAPNIPANAVSVSGLQTLSNWIAADDTAGNGTAQGTMSLVGSPSYGGQALEFATQFTNSGDERYSVVFGDDTTSANFVWDGWVYLTRSVNKIANLEMDMNQVMANGQTVIYGFQCDGNSGTWDYSTNAGTPESPDDRWVHTNAACNVQNWRTQKWHHVQIAYSRDESGNVTYQSVWLDGVQSPVNATAPAAYALDWGPVLLTNFEIDGEGSSGSSTVYLDDLTVYRW
ncbi:MAG: hypothetical protein WB622_12170 [Acidobacteriaceae bacterium]|jgi:hypothetical protein